LTTEPAITRVERIILESTEYLKTHLDIIRYFSQSIFRRNTLEDILWDITGNCIKRLNFVDCVVYFVDHERKVLVQKAAYGAKDIEGVKVASPLEIPIGQGIVGTVAATGNPVLVEDCSRDLRYIVDDEQRMSELCVPIVYQGQVIGVIDSEHPEPGFYKQTDLEILTSIATISATKIAKTLIEEQSEVLARFVKESPSPVLRLDPEGRILTANPASQDLIDVWEIKDGLVHDESILRAVKNALESGYNVSVEENYNNRLHNLFIVPVVTRNYVNIYASDITELNTAKLKAEEASKAKDEFLSIVSHEMRTPLNGILGISKLLQADKPSAKQKEYLSTLEFNGKSLLSLINDILDLGKIEAGKIRLDNHSYDLRQTLTQLYKSFLPKAEQKDNQLALRIELDLPTMVLGDQSRLMQILNNLINNAVKFTERGQIEIDVKAKNIGKESFMLVMKIKDTGIGISEDKQTDVFEAFEQAETSTNRKFGGTGLGLTITKKLVELMGGSIELESTMGRGSCFSVAIPLKLSSIEIDQSDQPFYAFDPLALEGQKILIVDDNTVNQLIAEQFLGNWGANIVKAANGFEAIDRFHDEDPDLILMDLQMPECDGYQATRHIRQLNHPKKDIPIIAVTADVMASSKERSIEAGIDDYITKPFDPQVLLQKIRLNLTYS
jgi:signal transduction histidine kinase/CheY-like chemotaxis protein